MQAIEVIEDYLLISPNKIKQMPAIRYDDLEWSQIKLRFYSEKE